MIPLKDTAPRGRKFTVLTYALIAVNSVIFFYMLSLSKGELDLFIQDYALIPAQVTQGQHLYSFLSSIFLHGGLAHLLGNMLFLHIFGDNIEAKLGRIKFLLLYFCSGILGSLGQLIISPSSKIPNLGASGAIAGLMGAYLYFFPKAKVLTLIPSFMYFRIIRLPAFFMLGYWFLFQMLSGFGSLGYAHLGGVAYFAHLGGFLSGLAMAKFSKK